MNVETAPGDPVAGDHQEEKAGSETGKEGRPGALEAECPSRPGAGNDRAA
jgi:hypothetical protein